MNDSSIEEAAGRTSTGSEDLGSADLSADLMDLAGSTGSVSVNRQPAAGGYAAGGVLELPPRVSSRSLDKPALGEPPVMAGADERPAGQRSAEVLDLVSSQQARQAGTRLERQAPASGSRSVARASGAGSNLAYTARDLGEALLSSHGPRITGALKMPAEPGLYADCPQELDARISGALQARGIDRLYSHQREAWDLVRAGRHTVVVTPTASGKSLCFNLPVLHAAATEGAKALYLFPTKALAQDQVCELIEIERAGGLGVRAFTFDGDTPGDARVAVRTRGDIVVSNPDMLHQGILPHHTKWAQFFESLRYVVIDELHTYRGVFGSHTANVMRRLRRICRFYGSDPVFIMCSATIANPAELASRLIEDEVASVERSGAPRGAKTLLFWNPPVVNRELGIRASARSQTSRIASEAVRAGLKTIVFAQTRVMVEVLTKYLKDEFDRDPRKPARVRAYRGGYLPTERRRTERDLREGDVDCVVATSALELGVDIGALDVCLLNGYPGSIAGTWQRLGRAGRRERDALGVLVASSQPLDQFIVRNPDFFLGASPEHARIDSDQLLILLDHVRCAAFELPFSDGESFGLAEVTELLEYLEDEQTLHHQGGKWHWMTTAIRPTRWACARSRKATSWSSTSRAAPRTS